jgi:hypothetical protein
LQIGSELCQLDLKASHKPLPNKREDHKDQVKITCVLGGTLVIAPVPGNVFCAGDKEAIVTETSAARELDDR